MIPHRENPDVHCTKKQSKPINKVSKVTEYKSNMSKSFTFLYLNKKLSEKTPGKQTYLEYQDKNKTLCLEHTYPGRCKVCVLKLIKH